MTLADILSNYTYVYILTFIRFLGLFLITPIFSSRTIPAKIKITISFFLALITIPFISTVHNMPANELMIVLEVLRELLIGFVIGFITLLSFAVIQLAGRFIDMRMGFAMVNVADPIHGETLPLMGQFKNMLAILLFFSINGHHLLLRTINHSFNIIPLGEAVLTNQAIMVILRKVGDLFILAFQISLPIIATLFIVDVILGFLARTMPQFNIFVVGLPLKLLIGVIMLFFSLNIILGFTGQMFEDMFQDLFKLLKLLH